MAEEKTINGDLDALRIDRALADLRNGRWIQVHDGEDAALVAAVDGGRGPHLDGMPPSAGIVLSLIISRHRAAALDLPHRTDCALTITIPAGTREGWIEHVALAPALSPADLAKIAQGDPRPASALAEAALELVKHSGLAPAIVARDLDRADQDSWRSLLEAGAVLSVSREQIEMFPARSARSLRRVGEATVPLFDSEDARFIVFRQLGSPADHLAIIVGRPQWDAPVPVRLHSACLTGDLFASLRCDCGEQLQTAVRAIVTAGGGVVLYLAQEGRGIGLANKMRAYALQDQGFDTVDADRLLGFKPDERRYDVAAAILKALGITAVRLLTNNPEKLTALEAAGIAIAERLPLAASVNPHNARYLSAKAKRAGHLLGGHAPGDQSLGNASPAYMSPDGPSNGRSSSHARAPSAPMQPSKANRRLSPREKLNR
jgi:GTP cyclohydrolase II